MNKYYFSLSMQFKKDIDLNWLQETLKIKATKLTELKDSKGANKTAKFYCKTKSFENIYPDEDFAKFVDGVVDNLADLPQIMQQYDGSCAFCIVFEDMHEKPCLSLSTKTIQNLYKIGASYDVDFI